MLLLLALVPLGAVFHALFSGFFPLPEGRLGHDYMYFLPALLDGHFWFLENGPWRVPWFTPSFCGGVPALPNPQSLHYSVPQLLLRWVEPVRAVYLTMLLFGLGGAAAFHLLLRRRFGSSPEAAAFAAVAFLFNGFFVHRLLIGHLTYHVFPLIPLAALVLLRPTPARQGLRSFAMESFAVGAILGYFVYAGALNFVVPAVLSLAALVLIHRLAVTGDRPPAWRRLAGGLAVASGLGAAKIVSALAFLRHFPRDQYPMQGAESLLAAFRIVGRALFLGDAHLDAAELFGPFRFEEHEYAFGVSPVAGVLLVGGGAFLGIGALGRAWSSGRRWRPGLREAAELGLLIGILLLPVALNTRSPGWTAVLESLPYIKSNTILLRWIALDIPAVLVLTGLVLDRACGRRPLRVGLAAVGIAGLLGLNAADPREFYRGQSYRSGPVVAAYRLAVQTGGGPPIRAIQGILGHDGRPLQLFGNDPLVQGSSPLGCYEPIFGYRLERLPVGSIRIGPALASTGGHLNVKEPSCYVFPEANDCEPGDHFSLAERESAIHFLHRRPVPFAMPAWQLAANVSTLLGLAIGLGLLGVAGASALRRVVGLRR